MKHALLFPVLSMVLLMTACRREPVGPDGCGNSSQDVLKEKADPQPVPQGDPLSQEELDRAVIGVLETNNDFQWPMVDLRTLWSATLYNDHSVSIGYKPANVGNIDDIIATIDIRKAEWRAVHDALINLVLEELNNGARVKVTLADILVEDDPVLLMKLLQAYFLKKDYDAVIDCGRKLESDKSFKKAEERISYAWAYYHKGIMGKAEETFMDMDRSFSNYVHRLEYCKFLLAIKRQDAFRDKLKTLMEEFEVMKGTERKFNINVIRQARELYSKNPTP